MGFEKPLKERIQKVIEKQLTGTEAIKRQIPLLKPNTTKVSKHYVVTEKHENDNKKKKKILFLSWGSNPPTKMLTIANQVY